MEEDTPLDLETLVANADAVTTPGQEAGASVAPCDSNITPIYPVRYAYANFFEKTLSEAAQPPELPDLLNATSISASKGYVVRLLRPGWIYIREEDDPASGYFHIFKYTRTEANSGEPVNEYFEKFTFTNGINAQGGLTRDNSAGRPHYPFAFVRKGQAQLSIAYSEHEWSANVIDRMNGSASDRAKAMQRINIKAESSEHTVAASSENFEKLIEDYRARQSRFFALREQETTPSLSGEKGRSAQSLTLDILTTEASYDMDASAIAREIQHKLCYGETARIVGLHDPVGRQKEIAQAHAKLAVWEKDYASRHMYPFMIGGFVQQFKNSSNEDVVEAVNENINLGEHQTFWSEMDAEFKEFENRQQRFAELYQSFMFPHSDPALVNRVGTLDTYFKYFFDVSPDGDAKVEAELRKLLETSHGIFEGLLASRPGKQALELALSDAAKNDDGDLKSNPNASGVIFESLEKLITQPQANFQWSDTTTRTLDTFLNGVGPLWGEVVAWANYSSHLSARAGNKLTAGALQYVVDKVVPGVLKVFGLKITGNTVRFTSDELGKLLSQAIEANVSKGGNAGLKILSQAEKRMNQGQRLLDWSNLQRKGRLPKLWSLAEVVVIRPAGERYAFKSPENSTQKLGLMFEGGFAGLSAFFNVLTINGLMNQGRYDAADPLRRGSTLYDAISFTTALAALTADTIAIGAAGAKLAPRILPASLSTRLVPALSTNARHMGRFLTGKLAPRVIAIANLAGTIVSAWDAYRAFNEGNYGETAGHAMIALGSATLFITASAGLFSTAGGTASTGVGAPIAVVIAGLALIVGGVGLVYWFSRTPFENLLRNCFWGNGPKYGFWTDEPARPVYADRLERAVAFEEVQTFYWSEVHEFMNYIYFPKLELERTKTWSQYLFGYRGGERTYGLIFTLPNFRFGQSEIIGAMYTASGFDAGGQIVTKQDPEATDALRKAIETCLETSEGLSQRADGAITMQIDVKLNSRANLIWYYMPVPGMAVPMRILADSGEMRAQSEIVGGMLNDRPL